VQDRKRTIGSMPELLRRIFPIARGRFSATDAQESAHRPASYRVTRDIPALIEKGGFRVERMEAGYLARFLKSGSVAVSHVSAVTSVDRLESDILLTASASRWSKSTKVSAGQSRLRNSSRVTTFVRGFQKCIEHTVRLFLEPNLHSSLAQFTSSAGRPRSQPSE
jgi:hypothetical protein